MGYFLLTNLLLDTIKASAPARIVNVSSEAHRVDRIAFDDLQRAQDYGLNVYGESKLMNVLFTYELARRLEVPLGRGWVKGVAKNAWRTVWLPREQIDILSGKSRSATGYLGWRLRRPFVMLGKAAHASWAWLGVKRRARGG